MTGDVEISSLDGSVSWGLEFHHDTGAVSVYRLAAFEAGSEVLTPDGAVTLPLPVLAALVRAAEALR